MASKTKVRIELNSAGVQALLKSPEVAADLSRRGAAIQGALPTDQGEEWAQSDFIGRDRAQTIVRTGNYAARKRNAEDMALLRALDAGR